MNVTVKARDENDREVRIKANGYLARILQHEIDHLDGILFTDRVEDRSTLQHVSDSSVEEETADDEGEVLVGDA
jgi:peptide deformylase